MIGTSAARAASRAAARLEPVRASRPIVAAASPPISRASARARSPAMSPVATRAAAHPAAPADAHAASGLPHAPPPEACARRPAQDQALPTTPHATRRGRGSEPQAPGVRVRPVRKPVIGAHRLSRGRQIGPEFLAPPRARQAESAHLRAAGDAADGPGRHGVRCGGCRRRRGRSRRLGRSRARAGRAGRRSRRLRRPSASAPCGAGRVRRRG